MNYDFTSYQTELLAATDRIVSVHCSAEAEAQRDKIPQYPAGLLEDMGSSGLLSFWADPNSGKFLDACIVQERLAYHSGSAPGIMFVNSAAVAMLSHGARSQTVSNIRDRALEGKLAFAFAMTEPQAGSDVSALKTSASKVAKGWSINGQKHYITGALDADYILVVARTAPDQPAKAGTSLFLVPRSAKGLKITKLDKLAGDSFATCSLQLDAVSVPADHLVGEENKAWQALFHGGLAERSLVAAIACGMAQRAFDQLSAFLRERVQFGQPVSQFQAVAHELADMATQIVAMRQLTYHSAWLAQEGRDCAMQINMAKLFASEKATTICRQAAQLSGGRGYFLDSELNRAAREVELSLYAGGTSQIMRNGIVRGLGL